jgi:16S rRNA processing protein RimM
MSKVSEIAMAATDSEHEARIVVGKISAPHGIKGWIKVHSYTDPATNILQYNPWQIMQSGQWCSIKVVTGKSHGKTLVAQLENVDNRDAAQKLQGCEIAIFRHQLPPTDQGDYYWIDLIGLKVINRHGTELGTVANLMETGANDVLIVAGDREYLIPYVKDIYVVNVDLGGGVIHVDWEEDF